MEKELQVVISPINNHWSAAQNLNKQSIILLKAKNKSKYELDGLTI